MKASETTVARLMQGQTQQFQIPLYQRTYSWAEKHLEQLWQDILEQARLLEEGNTATAHFLGSVVLAPSPQTEATFPRHLVVDGQQRLTTISIALTALRDHLADTDPQARERLNEQYLINKWSSGDSAFRLLPTQADRALYAGYVRGAHDGFRGGGRIGAAYQFFRRKLVAAQDPADPYDLTSIEHAITTRLALISVSADRDDNVHRIFESLNNTGKKLSQADLLRNYLFMRLRVRGEEVYETHWLPVQQSLSNEDLEHLMWLQLVLDGDERVRRQDLYGAQQARFEKQDTTEEDIASYVRELHRSSFHLRRILHPETEEHAGIRERLRRLQEWQATVTHPAVMLLLGLRDQGQADSDEVIRALSYIESFLVRRMLCWIPTNNLNRIFQAMPGQLPVGVAPADGIRQLLSVSRRFWPTDAELREEIRKAPFYERGRPNQRLFVLRRLEESFEHPEPVDFSRAELTIEHVMPQSPGEEWLDALAVSGEPDETPQQLHARLVHTLGNLTLTGVNSRLSNHIFERKKDLFTSSHLELNRGIAEAESWSAEEILARADMLTERAVKLWPGPIDGVSHVERGRDWGQLHEALAAMPDGTWTTYGDLAALIGSAPQAVGSHLLKTPGVLNAHRVLTHQGLPAEGFRWPGEDRGDVRDLLASECVEFTESGSAHPEQRLSTEELAALLGLQGDDRQGQAAPRGEADSAVASVQERWERFFHQLAADDTEAVVAAVRELLDFWENEAGGGFSIGSGKTYAGASLLLDRRDAPDIWPVTVYPGTGRGGVVEVAFQYLTSREPFTDDALRDELRRRFNGMTGVEIPQGKLTLRPSFRLSILTDEGNQQALREALLWFRDRVLAAEEEAG
ncbi:GmrSD restriction endonuclease domain-containing protein [Streptomyces gobiensis]|uniref:GmrSD restriction endonuclease domain-containing protein n=1 Tax=Streptomyces gobiensis TaxID=2875706 RepID=UPI001E345ECB|nr:DUF262 domain-containing protein [Streptomyces gobiensis]UGY90760.1 DUF262 domain-containing protein [Streptomyces gobiensis]